MSLVGLHKVRSATFIVFMISFGDFQEVAKGTALSLTGSLRAGLVGLYLYFCIEVTRNS